MTDRTAHPTDRVHNTLLARALTWLPFWIGLGGALSAQSFTSPRGLDASEGDASHFALFNPGYARFQQIDDTQRTHGATLRSIAFRRDFERTSPFGGPRSLDFTVQLGEADHAAAGATFSSNWFSPPTLAFARRPINTPDWSSSAAARPMPFELVLPLDAPFVFSGSQALAFELTMENVAASGSPDVDAELGTNSPFNAAAGAPSGFGCVAIGQPIEMTHTLFLENWGPSHPGFGMRIGTSILHAVPTQNVMLNLDFAAQSSAIPGMCGMLYVLPTFGFPLGTTDAFGALASTWIDLPFLRGLAGLHLYTQALGLAPLHPGIPVVLSDRRDAVMPDAPRLPPVCCYVYATSVGATSGSFHQSRGVVVRFGL